MTRANKLAISIRMNKRMRIVTREMSVSGVGVPILSRIFRAYNGKNPMWYPSSMTKYIPGSGKTGRINRKHAPRRYTHWQKLKFHGWTEVLRVPELGECWESRAPEKGPYRYVSSRAVPLSAHRVSYEHHKGPIPEGMLVRHRCDNPPCVNPEHLEVGTPLENMMDAVQRNRHAHTLSEAQVREIKAKLADNHQMKPLAREYGVTRSTIRKIARGETWKWVE
jgi:hypothetical protein